MLQKCHEEIDIVMDCMSAQFATPADGPTGLCIGYDQISQFVYLGQVIKETLRLHPPVQSFARLNEQEFELNGFSFPPDTRFGILVQAVHQHPEFWDRPTEFLPDRFSVENYSTTMKHPYQYIPFSAGPRNCIGQRFAVMEATVILAMMLHSFKVSIDAENDAKIRVMETIICGPKNMHIDFSMRQ